MKRDATISVHVNEGFWATRLGLNHSATVPHALAKCEDAGYLKHFEIAAGRRDGEHEGEAHEDSDLYKVLEGVCYTLAQTEDASLRQALDEWVDVIAAAQAPDGYINTYFTTHPEATRYDDIYRSHELYSGGHLIEAAVAHFEVTGERTLLDVAVRYAEHLDATFGPGKREAVPGHQELELALVRLWRVSGDVRHLNLARFFVDWRGRPDRVAADYAGMPVMEGDRRPGRNRPPEYRQDHLPAIEQRDPTGHAVRAGYFYAAVADIALACDSDGHAKAAHAIWESIVARHLYLSGGVGTHQHRDEGFGDDYRLPNDTAYCETCGGIALLLFTQRMSMLRRDARYADLIETILYNHMLACTDLDGRAFHYRNPLQSDGTRQRHPWPNPACCPSNIVRMIPQISRFVYAADDDAIYIDQFVSSSAELRLDAGALRIEQETAYPWNGTVQIALHPDTPVDAALHIRVPGWSEGRPVPSDLYTAEDVEDAAVSLAVNGEAVDVSTRTRGYVVIQRTWQAGDRITVDLPMPHRRVRAHEKVEADRGRVALMRGPLLYCVEGVDHAGELDDLVLADTAELTAVHDAKLLGGLTVIKDERAGITAVPYYVWNNRESGRMAVWICADR